jgi:hypothetical protein
LTLHAARGSMDASANSSSAAVICRASLRRDTKR